MWKTFKHILEIPFQSKTKLKGKGKYRFSGIAYYMLDRSGNVLRDFALLDSTGFSYRPNDNDMMLGSNGNGTNCFNRWKEERLDIFPNSPINGNQVFTKSENTITQINELMLSKATTALKLEEFITGSSTSGANLKISATPYYATAKGELYGVRFVNALKETRAITNNAKANQRYTIDLETLNKHAKLSIDQYFKKFPKNVRFFVRNNPEIVYEKRFEHLLETSSIALTDIKEKYISSEMREWNNSIARTINAYNDGAMKEKSLVNKLRGIQRSLLTLEQRRIGRPYIKNLESNPKFMDAAHFRDVQTLRAEKKYLLIADINNGILLPKDIHYKLDNFSESDKTGLRLNDKMEVVDKNGDTISTEYEVKYINDYRKINVLKSNLVRK